MKEKKECKHNYKKAIRKGRAHYICPKCKEDITLDLVLMHQAGIKI